MTHLEGSILVDSPRWSVWEVMTDPSYLPKLYMDAITVELDPPGRVVLGQKCKILGKIGNIRVEVPIQFTRVDKEACLASKSIPGGLFTIWDQTINIRANGLRTNAQASFEYELSPAYAPKVADAETMARVVSDNLLGYLPRLKEICELLSMPR